nr:hypothetical protein [Sicyoidochytrium minutum DNA virus]
MPTKMKTRTSTCCRPIAISSYFLV